MIEPDDSLPSPARREVLRGSAAALAAIGLASAGLGASGTGRAAAATPKGFPEGFIWGTATARHQVEESDVNSDMWFLEKLQPTLFAEPVGDANNSLELWPVDLDLVHSFNLNAYRSSLEWSRIEPEPGQFSLAMLDHYLRMIEGCRARGLQPIVTFNHFATPRWFAARGGWTNSESPALFERFCERAARHLAKVFTPPTHPTDPNLLQLLGWVDLPPVMKDVQRAM